jgi:hypothetical protein
MLVLEAGPFAHMPFMDDALDMPWANHPALNYAGLLFGRRALADLGRMVVRPPAKAIALWPSQTSLKIASASTACARKPTVKASVRKIGSPIV